MRRTDAGPRTLALARDNSLPAAASHVDELAARDRVGLLLLDDSLTPVWANAEAVGILMHPDPAPIGLTNAVTRRIRSHLVAADRGAPANAVIVRSVISGKRVYRCRVLPLDGFGGPRARPLIAVLLERRRSWAAYIPRMAANFRLTPRERQALTLLGHGLTTREMAERMRIRPNTLKAFLRVVMIKMGVSNRASIIGKVLAAQDAEEGHA